MAPENGQHPVFWFNLAAQHAAQLRKANEALQQVGFPVEMPDGRRHRMQRFIGKIPQKAGALPQKLCHQPVNADLLVLHAGEVAPAHQFLPPGGELM